MSHFSFTRNAYDECELIKRDQESQSAFTWATDSHVAESKSACHVATSPFMQNPFKSVPHNITDIESDLRGQTKKAGKCAIHKYDPSQQKPIVNPIKDCVDDRLVPEYTRMNKPCNIFSGITINRFHPLCEDLQDMNKISDNSIFGVNTRLQIKDAFRGNPQNVQQTRSFVTDSSTPCMVQGMSCALLKPVDK